MTNPKKYTNRYLIILVSIILCTFIIELTTPLIKQIYFKNWNEKLTYEIELIESETLQIIGLKENYLLVTLENLKSQIKHFSNASSEYQSQLLDIFNQDEFSLFSIEYFDSSTNLIAWTEINSDGGIINNEFLYNYGETHFYSNGLITFYSVTDTVTEGYLSIKLPVEKEYILDNDYYTELNLRNQLQKQFKTEVVINFNSLIERSKDGRKHSFIIYNNYQNPIGLVTINKPSRDVYLNIISQIIDNVQSLLIILLFALSGFVLYQRYRNLSNKLYKLLILFIYLFGFRLILLIVNFPSSFFETKLDDPSYYASTFGFGLFSTPFEFFLTAIPVLIIIVYMYKNYIPIKPFSSKDLSVKYYILYIPVILIIYLLLLRGLGASVRSIVFDSSIRYFNEPSLLPDLPTLFMNMNLLVLGFCSVTLSVILVNFLLEIGVNRFSSHTLHRFFVIFLLFQISAFIFDLIQNQPQGTPFIRVLFITVTFIFSYLVTLKGQNHSINYIYLLLLASIIVVNLLTFYNLELEKKTLKLTVNALTRSDESMMQFIIDETLSNDSFYSFLQDAFVDTNRNYDAAAFIIWSRSRMEKEAVSSNINLIDKNKSLLGSFGFQFRENFIWDWSDYFNDLQTKIVASSSDSSRNKIFRGITKVIKNGELIGYLEVSILYDINSLGFENQPDFIVSKQTFFNKAININKLKIFDFHNGKLVNYFTDLILSEEETKNILSTEFSILNDAWIDISLNKIENLIYAQKYKNENLERIIAVALEKKDLSWNLFDFFKIFFIHSIFILLILLFYTVFYKKVYRLKYSFRAQLLLSFLIISLIPLIFLATYFKNLTEDKNTSAIYYKLGKRADRVEVYINDYIGNGYLDIFDIYEKATSDLGINFSLFSGKELVFASQGIYYEIGLIPTIINPVVYNELIKTGLKEFVAEESIEGYNFHSFYHKAQLGGNDYVIKVNDVFNRIQLPMTGTEVNIFLFGSYSIAVLLIIIISTVLANQISKPISKLTSATKSVASGDLSIQLRGYNKGEVKDLVDGFNSMVMELKKNQIEITVMEREAAWKEMAKQVAHEIKNPLTPMKLAVQQLEAAYNDKSPKFGEIITKVSNTLVKQIENLKNIASEFSSFARMPRLKLEKINLIQILNETSDLFLEEIKISLKSFTNDVFVSADSEQLRRTAINIIRNSIQANATLILIQINLDENTVFASFRDDGKGIPVHLQNKIFDSNFTTKIEGMGLGLSLSKRFMESVGGDIYVGESSKKGTTIILKFPRVNL
ncbi:ATP-binding protein [Bacteroidota bacterium]